MKSSFTDDTALDRAIWTALTTTQAHLGYGNDLARRYYSDVAPFAAVVSHTAEAYAALAQLLSPGESIVLKTLDPIASIVGLRVEAIGPVDQMVFADQQPETPDDPDIVLLHAGDASDMHDLVRRAKPGPFGSRTLEMGRYIGIRENGRLVAMAGERMRCDGFVEISAVCVDPDCRGQGLARRVFRGISAQIRRQGATAFLHVLADNEAAIKLYKSMGFEARRRFFLSTVSRAPASSSM